jgi:hypothetical protein
MSVIIAESRYLSERKRDHRAVTVKALTVERSCQGVRAHPHSVTEYEPTRTHR